MVGRVSPLRERSQCRLQPGWLKRTPTKSRVRKQQKNEERQNRVIRSPLRVTGASNEAERPLNSVMVARTTALAISPTEASAAACDGDFALSLVSRDIDGSGREPTAVRQNYRDINCGIEAIFFERWSMVLQWKLRV